MFVRGVTIYWAEPLSRGDAEPRIWAGVNKQRPNSAILSGVPAFSSDEPTPGLETRVGLRHDYAAGASAFAGAGMKYAGI
jgi:hypothetical protein